MFEREVFDKYMHDSADYYDPREPLTDRKLFQLWKDGATFGYDKANEWHYVKDGDLPEHEINVLVLFNKQCIDIAHYNHDYKEWHFTDSIVRDVIAWKEITPPKENE